MTIFKTSECDKPFSSFRQPEKPKRFFDPIYIAADWSRPVLYKRINQRVDIMVAAGLVEEAKNLYPFKKLNALQTVGYKELFAEVGISIKTNRFELKYNKK